MGLFTGNDNISSGTMASPSVGWSWHVHLTALGSDVCTGNWQVSQILFSAGGVSCSSRLCVHCKYVITSVTSGDNIQPAFVPSGTSPGCLFYLTVSCWDWFSLDNDDDPPFDDGESETTSISQTAAVSGIVSADDALCSSICLNVS